MIAIFIINKWKWKVKNFNFYSTLIKQFQHIHIKTKVKENIF